MKQVNKPKFKRYIFAENAQQTTIEDVPDTQSQEQEAQGYIGYQDGYTLTNMKPATEGGKPPRGQQLNQLLKDITSVTQYATAGGTYSMDTAITGSLGYPKNAVICIDDVGLFRSLQDDNKVTDYNNTNAWQKIVDFKPPVVKIPIAVPDYTKGVKIDANLLKQGKTFTAPSEGVICISSYSNATTATIWLKINNVLVGQMITQNPTWGSSIKGEFILNKGDVVSYYCSDKGAFIEVSTFFPFKIVYR